MEIQAKDLPIEFIDADIVQWQVGPFHPFLPGQVRFDFELDGEMIVSARVETGFLYRGIEKEIEKQSWRAGLPFCDHIDPESALFSELCFCLAVEEIARIPVPPRAQMVRVILSELTRVSHHLKYISLCARACGAETIIHYVLRDREKILDLIELLTGARFSLNFLRFGGISQNMTEGFIERLVDLCEHFRIRMKEYNDLFSFNQIFTRRATGVSYLTVEQIERFGLTGPSARAAGVSRDIRKAYPYSGYEKIDFKEILGQPAEEGKADSYERYLIRLGEIEQSLEILQQAINLVVDGEFMHQRGTREFSVPPGEALVRVESPRGTLSCYVISEGGPGPHRVQFFTPSSSLIQAFPEMISGCRIADFPMILASLDVSISEIDK